MNLIWIGFSYVNIFNWSFSRRLEDNVCEFLCNHNRSWSLSWLGSAGGGGDGDDDDDDDVVVDDDHNEYDCGRISGLYMLRDMWFYSIDEIRAVESNFFF